jgi:AmmeMemoRadiSam system protein A
VQRRSPIPAADVLIELPRGEIVFVRRRNPPPGWAIPGGFAEAAATREALEETGLRVELESLFHVYSDPERDPRHHTLTVVYLGRAQGAPRGSDDALEARAFLPEDIPPDLAFDHHRILADYLHYKVCGERPRPCAGGRPRLSPEEKRFLLELARTAIVERARGRSPSLPEPPTARLREPGGAFVTLHRHERLRGCIGNLAFDRSLHAVVAEMALAAAFDDPRFPPVEPAECPDLDIEISVLSRPRPASASEIVAGWHGVSIQLGARRAVFLPQVAAEEGWTRRMLLEELCGKAGLPAEAWRDPQARLEVFTAEIFGDRPRPHGGVNA